MEEVIIVRTPGHNNLFSVAHVKWEDGHARLIKEFDSEVTFDYAVDLKNYHQDQLGLVLTEV